MGKLIDLTGNIYGRLTVLGRDESKPKGHKLSACWLCRCECGNLCTVRSCDLKSGRQKSCGCLRDEKTRERFKTHGLCKTEIYGTWCNVKDRCYNPKNAEHSRYGGRGIKMFAAWIDDFQAFYDYVSQLPHFGEKGYSLDRIDNNGDYCPENVRWANTKQQCRNKSTNIKVEYQGEEMTLMDAAEISRLPYDTLRRRYHRGDRGEELFRPVRLHKKYNRKP